MSHDENLSDNHSGNRSFDEVLEVNSSRRTLLKGSLALAATSFFGSSAAFAAAGGKKGPNGPLGGGKNSGFIGFKQVPLPAELPGYTSKLPVISEDYEFQYLIPWGTPLKTGIDEWDGNPDNRDRLTNQRDMVGIGHDGMHYFPMPSDPNGHGLLAINHEYGTNSHVLGKDTPESLEEARISQHAHGVSILEIKRSDGVWSLVPDSPYNRRITANTEMDFSGPVPFAPDSPIYDSGVTPRGTVNNCASGFTPWGTYLTCEENFNGYFGAGSFGGAWTELEEHSRYGIDASSRYGWELFDERFDLSSHTYASEHRRFGWIVEIDPLAPGARPVKRTALGRFKHEGIALTVGRGGRAVGYMGDDQAGDYIYKFVSSGNWKSLRAQGLSPLDHGKLYVARFNDDGTGDWLELTIGNPSLAAKFSTQEEVLTFARLSADILGATPMNRPEWTAVAPNGDVYCTLTNSGGVSLAGNAANPVETQSDGHIIRWHDSEQHTGLTFRWDIFILAYPSHGSDHSFSDPDGLWIDPDGRVFIQTDGGQKDGLQDQMLVANSFDAMEAPKRLFMGVSSDEITGIAHTPDRKTLFCNSQHPGNGNPAATNIPAEPDGITIPRDCTYVLHRKNGGVVGS